MFCFDFLFIYFNFVFTCNACKHFQKPCANVLIRSIRKSFKVTDTSPTNRQLSWSSTHWPKSGFQKDAINVVFKGLMVSSPQQAALKLWWPVGRPISQPAVTDVGRIFPPWKKGRAYELSFAVHVSHQDSGYVSFETSERANTRHPGWANKALQR